MLYFMDYIIYIQAIFFLILLIECSLFNRKDPKVSWRGGGKGKKPITEKMSFHLFFQSKISVEAEAEGKQKQRQLTIPHSSHLS